MMCSPTVITLSLKTCSTSDLYPHPLLQPESLMVELLLRSSFLLLFCSFQAYQIWLSVCTLTVDTLACQSL